MTIESRMVTIFYFYARSSISLKHMCLLVSVLGPTRNHILQKGPNDKDLIKHAVLTSLH